LPKKGGTDHFRKTRTRGEEGKRKKGEGGLIRGVSKAGGETPGGKWLSGSKMEG